MNDSGAPKSGLLIITEAEAGIKLLRFLERRLGLPRPSLFRLLRTGQVRVNKGRAKPERILSAGDEVRLPPQYAGLADSALKPSAAPARAAGSFAGGPESGSQAGHKAGSGAPDNRSGTDSGAKAGVEAGVEARVEEGAAVTDFSSGAAAAAYLEGSADAAGTPGAYPDAANLQGRKLTEDGPDNFNCPGLNIIRAERHYLVIDKPAGLPVQPGSGHDDSVSGRLKECAAAAFTPAPVHRLDRQSSGILLAGRSYAGQRYLHGLFSSHESEPEELSAGAFESGRSGKSALNRRYLAWVSGLCDFSSGLSGLPGFPDLPGSSVEPVAGLPGVYIFSDSIFQACGPDGYERMYVRGGPLAPFSPAGPGKSGEFCASGASGMPGAPYKPLAPRVPGASAGLRNVGRAVRAVSVFRVLKQLDQSPVGPASLLEVRLLTGRKHQIRVQCAARGFPLIGDKRYGGPSFSRMLLHAYALSIPAGKFQAVEFAAADYLSLPDWTGCFSVTVEDIDNLV